MSRLTIIVLGLTAAMLFSGPALAQVAQHDKVWVQGGAVTFTTSFNGANDPQNDTIDALNYLYFVHGHSNICDSSGQLAIISDGYNLYDRNLNYIEDGDTIVPKLLYEHYGGWSNGAQTSIILPFSNNIYRVITPTASDSEVTNYWWNHPDRGRSLFDLLLYTEVDMKANGGLGKVTKKMVPLLQDVKLSKTQMMACRHGDGKSWWLLKQASDTNMVYRFLLTDDKIYGPYIQGFPEPHFGIWDICGQAMFSQDGTKYATTIQGLYKVMVADFDRCTGLLSNVRVIPVPTAKTGNPLDSSQVDSSTCGLAFSPNGRFLYVNSFFAVQQCDLQNGNPSTAWTWLSGPDTTWQEFQQYSNIYPGPDGKLYVGPWDGIGGQMSVINNPDSKGTAAGFCRKCLRFPGFWFGGVVRYAGVCAPPCMPNYHLGPANPICYPTGIRPPTTSIDFDVYPNPCHNQLHIKYAVPGLLTIHDVTGRIQRSIPLDRNQTEIAVDVADLSSGVYICRYLIEGQIVETRKISVLPY